MRLCLLLLADTQMQQDRNSQDALMLAHMNPSHFGSHLRSLSSQSQQGSFKTKLSTSLYASMQGDVSI